MIQWTEDEIRTDRTIERAFTIDREGQAIPGVFWQPAMTNSAMPLVLLGHGGSGHKRNSRMSMLGHLFSGTYGWSAAAIDGPVHGDRGGITDSNDPAYQAMWQNSDPVPGVLDDWIAILDALSEFELIDAARIGYWGVSMGTMFGLPLVAAVKRIKVAVLGKAGMTGSSATRSGIAPTFEGYAPLVTQPVLFTMQWDDERFGRAGQLDLFDRIGSTDKRLCVYPGKHADNGPDSFEAQADFLRRYL
jgi:dienelactone hydrolase